MPGLSSYVRLCLAHVRPRTKSHPRRTRRGKYSSTFRCCRSRIVHQWSRAAPDPSPEVRLGHDDGVPLPQPLLTEGRWPTSTDSAVTRSNEQRFVTSSLKRRTAPSSESLRTMRICVRRSVRHGQQKLTARPTLHLPRAFRQWRTSVSSAGSCRPDPLFSPFFSRSCPWSADAPTPGASG